VIRRLLTSLTLAATGLTVAALPASASTTTVLQYSGQAFSGTVIKDASGHCNNGTAHSVTWKNGAYSFNGTSSYISVPASATLNPGTSNYSYAVTMSLPKGYTYAHDLSLVRRGASKLSGAYYKMELVYNKSTGNTHLECAMRDQNGVTGYVSTSASGLNDGAWHTLKCTKTASSISLTKGGSTYTKSVRLGNLSTTRQLNFGAEQVTATSFWEHFPGLMDDITITKG
jgi:uncharacterized membrane protein